MMEKKKPCYCPAEDLVTLTCAFLVLSQCCHKLIPVRGGTAPQVPRKSLAEHMHAGELSKGSVNWDLRKSVSCTKST